MHKTATILTPIIAEFIFGMKKRGPAMAESKTSDARPNALFEFLKQAESYVDSTVGGITKAVGNDEDAPLIESHGGALREQFSRLAELTRQRYEGANADARRMVDEFMAVQSVTTLARNAQGTFQASVAKGVFGGGIFSWIESNHEEIKKIIEMIWGLFGSMPDWLGKILQIIDQILKLVLGLFGGAVGQSRTKIMSELSTMEVEFWNELAAHKRYMLAANGPAADRED